MVGKLNQAYQPARTAAAIERWIIHKELIGEKKFSTVP
jgi:hypothetical protein